MTTDQKTPGQVQARRNAFEAWARQTEPWPFHDFTRDSTYFEDGYKEVELSLMWQAWQAAHDRANQPAATDEVIDVAVALEIRRVLEEVKSVSAIHPCADMPTPFQSGYQQACEEIFYRVTGQRWHMDEDAAKFAHVRSVQAANYGSASQPEASEVTDTHRLDWIDSVNKRFQMGWAIGSAPAGNLSVRTTIYLAKDAPLIREAIDAAMAAAPEAPKP
jgi:hypothetical protein